MEPVRARRGTARARPGRPPRRFRRERSIRSIATPPSRCAHVASARNGRFAGRSPIPAGPFAAGADARPRRRGRPADAARGRRAVAKAIPGAPLVVGPRHRSRRALPASPRCPRRAVDDFFADRPLRPCRPGTQPPSPIPIAPRSLGAACPPAAGHPASPDARSSAVYATVVGRRRGAATSPSTRPRTSPRSVACAPATSHVNYPRTRRSTLLVCARRAAERDRLSTARSQSSTARLRDQRLARRRAAASTLHRDGIDHGPASRGLRVAGLRSARQPRLRLPCALVSRGSR